MASLPMENLPIGEPAGAEPGCQGANRMHFRAKRADSRKAVSSVRYRRHDGRAWCVLRFAFVQGAGPYNARVTGPVPQIP